MDVKTAILVDGSFFVRRVHFYHRKYFAEQPDLTGQNLVDILLGLQRKHLSSRGPNSLYTNHLYRVFYYDCKPLDLSIHYPVPMKGETKCRMVNFSKLPENQCRLDFLELLKKQRKVALRLGHIKHHKKWALKSKVLRQILRKEFDVNDLEPNHFYFESEQKGVDTKLGIDIASLAYERHVDQIILIAGDSDFVPASKLARRKGIDFVLDALKNDIDSRLDEHIDGLTTYDLVSMIGSVLKIEPDLKPSWWGDKKPNNNNRRNKKHNPN